MSNSLKIDNLSLSIEGKRLVNKANYTFFGGKIYRITGDNGTGKSTLLAAIAGLLDEEKFKIKGNIFFDDKNITDMSLSERVHKVGVVLSPITHALIGQKVEDELSFALFNMKKSYEYVEKMVSDIAEKLGITHLLGMQTNKLSSGQNAMIAFAAALCMDSDFYLLDEIFGTLDECYTNRVIKTLIEEREKGKCIIFVNHSLPEALIVDKSLTIAEGILLCV